MATVTSLQDDKTPAYNTGVWSLQKVQAFTNAIANSGDQVNVFKVPAGAKKRLFAASVRVSASLGAGCTVQLRVNRGGSFTVLTPATTAAAAGRVTDVAQTTVPFDLQGGDIIELLVGGAAVGAAATVTTDLLIADRQ